MKRVSLGWACRQASVVGLAVFIGVGFYGVFHFLLGSPPPPPQVTFYVGNLTALFPSPGKGARGEGEPIQVGEIVPNCGLEQVCPERHFPVHVYSGKSKDDRPRVCVSGKYIIDKDVNSGGRGLNIVVVEARQMRAVAARRFDTYAADSKGLESFLKGEVLEGDILVAVTFDEASRNLGPLAKNLLAELGSSQIQNLQFRGQWFMVSQKGMKGFSPHEELKPSKGGMWAPVDEKLCVPQQLKGRTILPDPPVNVNTERVKFCATRPHITDFCSVSHRDTPLRPAILTNHQYIGSAMFSTPIMVLAGGGGGGGGALSDLALTLQTLLGQPGVQNKYVVVVYDPRHTPDAPALCRLFKFGAKAVVPGKFNGTLEYYEVLRVVFEAAHTAFPGSPFVTVVEAGLLLAPDFLAYTAALLPLLHDPTLLAISAWNPNGYPSVSTRPDLAYRTEDFPGLAFTLRMSTYLKEMRHNMKECCNRRGWAGWLELGRWDREVVVPDVSRVLRRPVGGGGGDLLPPTPLSQALFHRLRATNLEMTSPIHNADSLTAQRYETHLAGLLNTSSSSALTLTPAREEVVRCANQRDTAHIRLHLNADSPGVAVLPYKEDDLTGFAGMKVLCVCFGLFYEQDSPPRGLHRGLLRFSMKGSEVIFLSNHSPHFHTAKFASVTLTLP